LVPEQPRAVVAGELSRHGPAGLRAVALHVGLNALHLVPGETGGGETYLRRLAPALLQEGLRLTVFAGREAYPSLSEELEGAEVVRVPVTARSRVRRVLAEQTLLPAAARRAGIDLLHNTLNTAPAIPGLPQVTTIHDVIYKRYPETAGLLNAGVAVLVPLAARRSRRVITVSNAAKEDIVRFLGVRSDRVDVTPNGPGLPEPANPLAPEELRRRFALGDAPLVLTVAAKRPHKNLGRLIDAVARLETDAVLVVPGFETPHEAELRARAGERIRFLGWVADDELDGLYRAARCFVLPSLAEGFGLPVLEAMLRGTPVACSRVSSLPEVAGDAALYFDPLDPAAIEEAIAHLLADEQLRARLRATGLERARTFTWEAAAESTLASYERALSR
jgi:glycosyltransferase involved in cell wall biosynthesis